MFDYISTKFMQNFQFLSRRLMTTMSIISVYGGIISKMMFDVSQRRRAMNLYLQTAGVPILHQICQIAQVAVTIERFSQKSSRCRDTRRWLEDLMVVMEEIFLADYFPDVRLPSTRDVR